MFGYYTDPMQDQADEADRELDQLERQRQRAQRRRHKEEITHKQCEELQMKRRGNILQGESPFIEVDTMNETQFNLLAEKLIKSTTQREAIKLHMLDGLSAYEAEKQAYGRITATVSRDAKRILKEFRFADKLISGKLIT